eukprot:s4114_g8.t1
MLHFRPPAALPQPVAPPRFVVQGLRDLSTAAISALAEVSGSVPKHLPHWAGHMASATPLLKDDKAKPGCVLGVLSEGFSPDAKNSKGDPRVSMVPDVAAQLMKDGYAVYVEKGAGVYAGFSDQAYADKGCLLESRGNVIEKSQVLFALEAPVQDFSIMNCKVLVSWVGRLQDKGKESSKKQISTASQWWMSLRSLASPSPRSWTFLAPRPKWLGTGPCLKRHTLTSASTLPR